MCLDRPSLHWREPSSPCRKRRRFPVRYLRAECGFAVRRRALPLARRSIGSRTAGENNRGGRRGRLRCQRGRGTAGTNHRDLGAHELAYELRQATHLTLCPAIFDADIAVFDVTGLTQPLAERGHEMSECPGRSAVEEPDHRQPRLLRARRQRPRRSRTADKRYELASSHGSLSPRITPYHTVVGKPCCASPQNWLQMAETVLRTALAARSLETIHFGSEYCG